MSQFDNFKKKNIFTINNVYSSLIQTKLPSITFFDFNAKKNMLHEQTRQKIKNFLRLERFSPINHSDIKNDFTLKSNPIPNQSSTSKIWGRLIGALDSSELIVQVITAKDPIGSRSLVFEHFIRRVGQKYCILLMNKCDLVPAWVTKRWLNTLRLELFTIAFRASITRPIGRVALLSVIRKFSRVLKLKDLITVSFMGSPGVGKSSVVNTLRGRVVCETAVEPGTTRICQFVTEMKKVLLIDCPGFTFNRLNNQEIDIFLNSMVRNEVTNRTTEYLYELLRRIKCEHIKRASHLDCWSSVDQFIRQLSQRSGQLLLKGRHNLALSAKKIVHDWHLGKFPSLNLPSKVQDDKKVRSIVH